MPKSHVVRDGREKEVAVETGTGRYNNSEGRKPDTGRRTGSRRKRTGKRSSHNGESDEITKPAGAGLLSGSFVVSGECLARLTAVGRDSYISKLTLEATKDKKTEESEMIKSLDKMVRVIGIIIIPVGAVL